LFRDTDDSHMSDEKKYYDLHPEENGPAANQGHERPPGSSGEPEPAEATPGRASTRRRPEDTCPSCGAAMPGGDSLVCLRCGFDLKTLRHLQTATGETTEDEHDEGEAPPPPPLCQPGRGDLKVPGVIAAACGLVLVLGYLAGLGGLFPDPPPPDQTLSFGDRIAALGRGVVLVAIWFVCAFGGLLGLGGLLGRPLGDVRLALARSLAIATAMRLVTVIGVGSRFGEWALEAIGQAAVFVALAVWLLRLSPRDAVTYAFLVLAGFVVLWAVGHAVVWVT
jgi:hypothetical protein